MTQGKKTSGFMDAADMALYIRERRPEIKIVFGNVHVSSLGAPILEKFPEIDYLVIGEGCYCAFLPSCC